MLTLQNARFYTALVEGFKKKCGFNASEWGIFVHEGVERESLALHKVIHDVFKMFIVLSFSECNMLIFISYLYYFHDYFDSLFFLNQEVPEWNSWTTLFGRNDGCWSLVRWLYMHLRHWRCCGKRRRWAPPPPIIHPTWSRDWLVVWAEVDCWLWGALVHPHFRGWGGCLSLSILCVCVFMKKKAEKIVVWGFYVHEGVEKL